MEQLSKVLSSEQVFIALITGLLGLIPILIKWYSDRNHERSKQHYLTKLSNELEFLKQWSGLHRSGSEDPETKLAESRVLQPDLDRILEDYRALKNEKPAEPAVEIEVPLMRRAFLLFLPTTWKSWIYHTIFYILLFFTTGFVLIGLSEETLRADWEYFVFVVIVFGTPLILFQRAAARIRKQEVDLAKEARANATTG